VAKTTGCICALLQDGKMEVSVLMALQSPFVGSKALSLILFSLTTKSDSEVVDEHNGIEFDSHPSMT
jgi:hypothetical protein